MSKKDNVAAVPKYRFPEFALDASINYVAGGFIFDPITNRNHHADLPILAITQEYGAIPRDEIDYKVSVTKKSLKAYKIVEKGDFIISLRSFQGGIEYSMYDGICSPAYIILRKKTNIIDQYYKYYFKSHRFIQDLNKDLEGIRDGKMISYGQFSSILLPKPDEEEQQKIVDCLSSIDDLISVEEKKLSLLNDYKKGWMQKLFPTEGRNVPEWRFPEFKDRGEWTSDLIANVISTIRPPKKLSTFEYKMIGRYPIVDQGQDEFCGWTDERSSLVDFDNKVLIFGDHTCVVKLVDRPFAQGADGIKIISTKKKISVDFLFQYLCNSPIISISYKRHFSELKEKTILFPDLDSGEQEKISRFLFSIDILIKKEKNKITELKQHKKALMQGLFPTVEEVL